jgi:hypothetical protein
MAAKAFGAGKVAVVDMNETNLEVKHTTVACGLLSLSPTAATASSVAAGIVCST